MPTAKVRWYSEVKGYGFIEGDNGGKDMFVHASALKESGISSLKTGDNVSFDSSEQNGKVCAKNLKIVG